MSNQLIKKHIHTNYIDEEIIYNSDTLDYIITSKDSTGEFFCYGNQRLNLTTFLVPGLTSKVSVESSEFLLTSDVFSEIVDLFNIEQDKIYYLLRIKDNDIKDDELKETLFLFSNREDLINFNAFLTHLSLSYKESYIKLNKKD